MRTLLALVAAGAGGALGGCLPGDVTVGNLVASPAACKPRRARGSMPATPVKHSNGGCGAFGLYDCYACCAKPGPPTPPPPPSPPLPSLPPPPSPPPAPPAPPTQFIFIPIVIIGLIAVSTLIILRSKIACCLVLETCLLPRSVSSASVISADYARTKPPSPPKTARGLGALFGWVAAFFQPNKGEAQELV